LALFLLFVATHSTEFQFYCVSLTFLTALGLFQRSLAEHATVRLQDQWDEMQEESRTLQLQMVRLQEELDRIEQVRSRHGDG